MNHDPIVEEIYHHAYAETLFNRAHEVLCPACSKLLETEALERYQRMMAKRREQLATIQAKVENEKAIERRRKALVSAGGQNQPPMGESKPATLR